MDLMAIRYIVLVAAVLIFLWAAVEMSLRIRRRRRYKIAIRARWSKLDTASPLAHQAVSRSPSDEVDDDDQEEQRPEQDLHLRAQQNGHHPSESKKRL